MRTTLSNKRTIGILFLEGFVSVSLQMLMMRQLVPFVGSSVVVSSLVVGVFLASLAIGYAYGGRVKENHISKLAHNLIYSVIILSIGLSYDVMNLIFSIFNHVINNPLIEVSLYLIIFLAPIVFMLGQTVPLLTNFYKSKSVSEIAGDSFAINTVGSVLGSVITAIIFFNYFGMAMTIFIDVIFLGIVLFMLLDKSQYLKYGVIYSLIAIFSFYVNVDRERNNFILTNAYNNYEVKEDEKGKYFIMNQSYSSAVLRNGLNWAYIDEMKKILFSDYHLNLKDADILILGAGGFTLSDNVELPDNKYVYIDIDPDIKKVAEMSFLLRDINGEFIAEDARLYVNKEKKQFDAVIVDLYSNKTSIPWHLLTNEFMEKVKERTKTDGYVLFNIISNGLFKDEYTRTIHNTITNNFPYCHSSPTLFKDTGVNSIYVCMNIEDKEKNIYIDDKARSVLDEIGAN